MIILTIRTDKPEAEIGLYDDRKQLAYETWPAHRELAETLHTKITELLQSNDKALTGIEGLAVFQGPGSFTGLRIGITVANALAYSLHVPVVTRQDPDWIEDCVAELLKGKNDTVAMPEYGALPNITIQKK